MKKLSEQNIEMLIQNTIAVMTHADADKWDWRGKLQNIRKEMLTRGNVPDEQTFVDALLLILDDKAPTIPSENLYYEDIQSAIMRLQQVPKRLTDEDIETFVQNTIAVCTVKLAQRSQWHADLADIRRQMVEEPDDATNELAFVDALLAILDEHAEAVTLPLHYPYARYVDFVHEQLSTD